MENNPHRNSVLVLIVTSLVYFPRKNNMFFLLIVLNIF